MNYLTTVKKTKCNFGSCRIPSLIISSWLRKYVFMGMSQYYIFILLILSGIVSCCRLQNSILGQVVDKNLTWVEAWILQSLYEVEFSVEFPAHHKSLVTAE